ncbi:isopentenyl-diphosphate delta-isomerase [Marivita sp. GX14005]|uniref:isopentenyl-diphosphate delta-isomerase n=1 Tax=Marivita sp. GX14005 TaxID=2942276 RepID=UPI00201A21FF|nr:isopentenyl-diphosphate delta-isomerase [Marivita sp. GX14005]MCL3881652.1 isopentenyl-diphosphate delta-isomerase [Marivita sp. GX14005]
MTLIPAWIDGKLVPAEKLDVHKRGLRHKAVSVFVICDGEILIQQRALSKYHTPGLWANTCCTHPEWNEPSLDCAHRRLSEELGIFGIDLEHRGQVEYRADVGGDLIEHELVDVYLARPASRPETSPNPDEVMALKWVSYSDLLREISDDSDRFTPWLRIYIETYASQILGRSAYCRDSKAKSGQF